MMGHTYGQEILVEVLGRDRVVSADEHGQTHAQASRGRNGLHNLDQSRLGQATPQAKLGNEQYLAGRRKVDVPEERHRLGDVAVNAVALDAGLLLVDQVDVDLVCIRSHQVPVREM